MNQLAQRYRDACMDELSAIKPGNVHIFADGHGMVVQDFIQSADASMHAIAKQGCNVGERIFYAIEATWQAVSCNTNLGIVLLISPLIQAILNEGSLSKQSVGKVLNELTIDDAKYAYRAIKLASPAGLGELDAHDVSADAEITLLAAMQIAADRDLVARQYANQFDDVFDLGLKVLSDGLAKWERPSWAVTAVYLSFVAKFLDSHIVRKYGEPTALEVQQEAKHHLAKLLALDNPKLCLADLLAWDASLKQRGINPGTSADLTVATCFAGKYLLA